MITFPARPIDGGPLHHARPKPGVWFVEPKINDWRAFVHVASLTMFNRLGEPFSIADKFTVALERLHGVPCEWLDVLALERRHSIGRGSIILMDYLRQKNTENYVERRRYLELVCATREIAKFTELNVRIAPESVLLMPTYKAEGTAHLYDTLRQCNAEMGEEFFEGVVMKKATAPYPVQLRGPDIQTAYWVKHRWHF
jgi:hypothetical protein